MNSINSIFKYLILEPIKENNLSLIILRTAQILYDKTNGRSNAWFCFFGRLFRPKLILPKSAMMSDEKIRDSIKKLKDRGWDILPFKLSESDITEFQKFAFSQPAYAKNLEEKIVINKDSIPNEYGRYMWKMDELLKLPVVQNIITNGPFHQIAQLYIDSRPIMTSISLWLDPVYDKKYDAHVYHYDNDGPAFLKFFIYLSDVDLDSGAHTYIETSHGTQKPAHLSRSRRYDKKELTDYYGEEKEIVFGAPAGTIIAEDTSGFHKGTTPKKSHRLLFQIQYALFDIPNKEERLPGFKKATIANLDSNIRNICRKFIA